MRNLCWVKDKSIAYKYACTYLQGQRGQVGSARVGTEETPVEPLSTSLCHDHLQHNRDSETNPPSHYEQHEVLREWPDKEEKNQTNNKEKKSRRPNHAVDRISDIAIHRIHPVPILCEILGLERRVHTTPKPQSCRNITRKHKQC